MTVEHIKINQIDKAESVKILLGVFGGAPHAVGIAGGKYVIGNALAGKNIVNLSDRQGIQTGIPNGVQHGLSRRLQ